MKTFILTMILLLVTALIYVSSGGSSRLNKESKNRVAEAQSDAGSNESAKSMDFGAMAVMQ